MCFPKKYYVNIAKLTKNIEIKKYQRPFAVHLAFFNRNIKGTLKAHPLLMVIGNGRYPSLLPYEYCVQMP